MSEANRDSLRSGSHYATLKHPSLELSVLDKFDDTTVEFLHATISNDDQELKTRIIDATTGAYAAFPFVSIRLFLHVRLDMPQHHIYPQVLAAGKSGQTQFAEIGCCMGSELRKLAYDGYPATNIIGIDVIPNFIEAGYALFRDRDTTPIRFIKADIFSVPLSGFSTSGTGSEKLAPLLGTLTHINLIRVFHLFNEEKQKDLARVLVALLKREPGVVLFGRQAGFEPARVLPDPPEWKTTRWGHSPASWADLWKSVFAEVESAEWAEAHVRVQAAMEDTEDLPGDERYLVWSVEII